MKGFLHKIRRKENLIYIPFIFTPFIIYWIGNNQLLSKGLQFFIIVSIIVLLIGNKIISKKLIDKGRSKTLIVFIIINTLIIGSGTFGSKIFYNFDKTMRAIEENQKKRNIDISFVVLNDSEIVSIDELNNSKLGLLSDESSYEGYIIPLKLIDDNDFSVITFYEKQYNQLINELIEGNYDVIVLPSNFNEIFKENENVSELLTNLKVIHSYQEEIIIEQEDKEIIKGNEPFNLLLIGNDAVSFNNAGTYNFDVIVLATINPKSGDIALTSVMRDTYVYSECIGGKDKINHNGWPEYGPECLMSTIEDMFEVNVDYYMLVDFKGIVEIVDAIGGIRMDVPFSFWEQDSQRRPNKVYLEEGKNRLLDGEQALAFARNRTSGGTSALERSENHIVVLEAIAKQMISIDIFSNLNSILDVIETRVKTNVSGEQMKQFYNIALEMLKNIDYKFDNLHIEKQSMKGEIRALYSTGLGFPVSMWVIYEDNFNKVKEIIQVYSEEYVPINTDFEFNLTKDLVMEHSKTVAPSTIAKDPRTAINLIGLHIDDAKSWERKLLNFELNYTYEYNDNVPRDYIVSQQISAGNSLNHSMIMNVQVSKGKKGEYITLSNFTNWTYHQILDYINKKNMTNASIDKFTSSNANHNHFAKLSSGYNIGDEINKNSNIVFYISYKPSTISPTKPTLNLYGDKTMVYQVGDVYNEPGFYAWDTIDWNLHNKVTRDNLPNMNEPGTYVITYSVVNSNGLERTNERTVKVVE